MKARILDTVLLAVMVVLGLDLLYLYFADSWYDPNPIVEKTELAVLIGFSIVSLTRVVMRLRELRKERRRV